MSFRDLLYFGLASALGLFTFVFFILSHNARLKARLWTAVHVLAGAIFIAFMLGRDLSMPGTFFTVFGTLAFIYLSLGNSRFCARCSSLIFGPERPEWRGKCPACGEPLPWSVLNAETAPPPGDATPRDEGPPPPGPDAHAPEPASPGPHGEAGATSPSADPAPPKDPTQDPTQPPAPPSP